MDGVERQERTGALIDFRVELSPVLEETRQVEGVDFSIQ